MGIRKLGLLSAMVAAAALTGCNGAGYTCGATLESFENLVNKRDWAGIVELYHPAQRQKFGDNAIKAWAEDNYHAIHYLHFDSVQEDQSWNVHMLHTVSSYYLEKKGDQHNVGGTFACLPMKGGKWYLGLPGAQ